MKTAWAHLSNAKHIDRVLASLAVHTDHWNVELDEIRETTQSIARDTQWDAAQEAAWDAAQEAAWSAAEWSAVYDAAYAVAWSAGWDVLGGTVWRAAWGAIMTLIAWDHSDQYLGMTPDQLAVWSVLSSDPACVLLKSYVRVLAGVAQEQQAQFDVLCQ